MFFVLGPIALWFAMITAVASAIDYYRRFTLTDEGAVAAGSLEAFLA